MVLKVAPGDGGIVPRAGIPKIAVREDGQILASAILWIVMSLRPRVQGEGASRCARMTFENSLLLAALRHIHKRNTRHIIRPICSVHSEPERERESWVRDAQEVPLG